MKHKPNIARLIPILPLKISHIFDYLLVDTIFSRDMSKKKSKIKAPVSPKQAAVNPDLLTSIKPASNNSVELHILAKPGSKQNCLTGIDNQNIQVQVNAPPVEGAANAELKKYLASVLDVKQSSVQLQKGHKSRNKVFEVSNMSAEDIQAKLLAQVKTNK
ncbi:uncharacterized protein LOC115876673 [Sitophilus oryzae]|uniref:Uncharacterized protein LOC115876673 n=1 Tax=Sitophilus oryzae TaxID=7048 RepID=A0A6J2XC86_SITOR|nr:uncharacterized protein LOC115876673 [Sitophilus oryzae]